MLSQKDFERALGQVQKAGKVPFYILRCKSKHLDVAYYCKVPVDMGSMLLTQVAKLKLDPLVVVQHSKGLLVATVEYVITEPTEQELLRPMRWVYSIIGQEPQFIGHQLKERKFIESGV